MRRYCRDLALVVMDGSSILSFGVDTLLSMITTTFKNFAVDGVDVSEVGSSLEYLTSRRE